MMREVYIDGKQCDVDETSDVNYIFDSPIFRDITKILSNRTTTYKLPKTENNLSIIGFANNPEVISDFPFKMHTISEYRNGLLFIKGLCTLLSTTAEDLEFSVTWGNTTNFLTLKDLKLRELSGNQHVEWNANSTFLDSSSIDQYGFVVVDFGKGITDFRYIHPSITIQGILDIITASQGVNFIWPGKFDDVFKDTWIPLLDNKPNQVVWDDYTVMADCIGQYSTIDIQSQTIDLNANYLELEAFGANRNGVINRKTVYVDFDCNLNCSYSITFHSTNPRLENGQFMDCYIDFSVTGNERMKPIRISANADGSYSGVCFYNVDSFSGRITLIPRICYVDKQGKKRSINDLVIDLFALQVRPYPETLVFGDKFPIIPNLPDLSVVDFLKNLMQLYGLYVYYDYSKSDSTIEFLSIDDMYLGKKQAYDWTDKVASTNNGNITTYFAYGDYARKNYVQYAEDSTVSNNGDSYIAIDNETLKDTKDLFKLSFAVSDNYYPDSEIDSEIVNVYAKINYYNTDSDNTNSVKYRLLTLKNYKGSEQTPKKSIHFSELQKFGSAEGLLNTYYSTFIHVLKNPVVCELSVYLKDYDLATFKERYPVYIDGVYYMPITVTVNAKGLATCSVIKMPYREE